MRNKRFIFCFVMALLVQMVLAKYCQAAPYLYISLLPAMILCMPTSRKTGWTMTVAFIAALAVDTLADGVPGLNAVALVPVAAGQKYVIKRIIDEDIVERHYTLSLQGYGYLRVGTALAILSAVYFTLYTVIDCAGTRNFGFILMKIVVSWGASIIFGMILINVLCPYQRK